MTESKSNTCLPVPFFWSFWDDPPPGSTAYEDDHAKDKTSEAMVSRSFGLLEFILVCHSFMDKVGRGTLHGDYFLGGGRLDSFRQGIYI